MRRGHQAWPRLNTQCDDANPNDFRFDFRGLTRRNVKFDGTNTITFKRIDSVALAVSYTWYRGRHIEEFDLLFNLAYPWTNSRKNHDAYHIRNVATHEIGHHIGLDDLSDPHGALTMFGKIGKGERSKRTLGKGDIKGAATVRRDRGRAADFRHICRFFATRPQASTPMSRSRVASEFSANDVRSSGPYGSGSK